MTTRVNTMNTGPIPICQANVWTIRQKEYNHGPWRGVVLNQSPGFMEAMSSRTLHAERVHQHSRVVGIHRHAPFLEGESALRQPGALRAGASRLPESADFSTFFLNLASSFFFRNSIG